MGIPPNKKPRFWFKDQSEFNSLCCDGWTPTSKNKDFREFRRDGCNHYGNGPRDFDHVNSQPNSPRLFMKTCLKRKPLHEFYNENRGRQAA